MGRGQYDRSAARARREAAALAEAPSSADVAPLDLVPEVPEPDAGPRPTRIRLLEPHGFVDRIGAVYGPKAIGYETSNEHEIAVLVERGAAFEVVG